MFAVGVYEIEKEIARTEGGALYRGRDTTLGRTVALKCVTDPQLPAAERLRGEGRLLGSLHHPHVVDVYELLDGSDAVWLVEEWVDGHSLAGVVERTGRLSAKQALGVTRAALEGLAYAHGRDIVHGDVSLTNILVDRNGVSKLIDFGLARSLAAETSSEAAYGTVGFSSPQVVGGQAPTVADDVYSAGVVLACLMLGRALFAGTTPQAVLAAQQTATGSPSELQGITPAVQAVLTNALAPQRSDRYLDAAAFLAALDEAAERDHGRGWLAEAGLATVMAGLGSGAVTAAISTPTAATVAASEPARSGVRTGAEKAARAGRQLSKVRYLALGTAVVVAVASAGFVVHQRRAEPTSAQGPAPSVTASVAPATPPDPTPTPPVAPASLTWSGVGTVFGPVNAISCPTSTFCALSDETTKTVEPTLAAGNLTLARADATRASCVSEDFCLFTNRRYDVTRWDGTATRPFPRFVNHDGAWEEVTVACPTQEFCVASGNGYVSVWNGQDWSGTQLEIHGQAVGQAALADSSCASPSLCVWVGAGDDIMIGGPGADGLAAVWDGSRWSSARTILRNQFSASVSCAPNTGFCLAANRSYATWDGKDWSNERSVPGGGKMGIADLSCVSASFCVGVGGLKQFLWNGTDWSAVDIDGAKITDGIGLVAVSCLADYTCFAADRGGDIFVSQGQGVSSLAPVSTASSAPTAAAPTAAAPSASKAATGKSSGAGGCDTLTSPGGDELVVKVLSGKVTCAEAKSVFETYMDDSTPTSGSGHFAEFDGWSCMSSSAAEFDANGWVWNCQGDRGEAETRCGSIPPSKPGEIPTLCQTHA